MSAEIKYNMMLGLNKNSWFRNLVQGLRGMMTTDFIFYWRNMSLTCLIFTTEIYKKGVDPSTLVESLMKWRSQGYLKLHTLWFITEKESLFCSVSLLLLFLFVCLLFKFSIRKNKLSNMKEKKDSLILTKVLQETPVYVSINQSENV